MYCTVTYLNYIQTVNWAKERGLAKFGKFSKNGWHRRSLLVLGKLTY